MERLQEVTGYLGRKEKERERKRAKMYGILKLIAALLLFPFPVFAGSTINCEDCAQATVAAAIVTAVDGDTITIPAGSCSWTSGVVVPDNEKLTIRGAGAGSTVITAAAVTVFDPGYSGSEISGLTIKTPETGIGIRPRGTGWKVHHCAFEGTTALKKTTAILPQGGSTSVALQGVIYNCTFLNARNVVAGSAQMLADGNSQHEAWTRTLGLGGVDAVYVEGNTFTVTDNINGNVMDSNYGGAYVFRHNTMNGASIEAHSVQGRNRAARKWEIYNNLIGNTDNSIYYPFRIRGGTGVIFGNRLTGNWSNKKIAFDNVRSYDDVDPCGLCDGDGTWDSNEDATGYLCRDQIGSGPDAVQWEDDPAGANTQTKVPAYVWNNYYGETLMTVDVINDSGDHIQKDRDYFDAQHPTYTCYDCPHPLTGYTGTCDPNTAGRDGYNITKGLATMGSGGTATLGAGGTITLTSP